MARINAPYRKVLSLALLVLLIIVLYLFRYEASQAQTKLLKDGDKVRVSSMVSDEPQARNGKQLVKMGKFSFFTDLLPEYHYGDNLEVEGILQKTNYGWQIDDTKVFTSSEKRGDTERYSLIKPLSNFRQKLTDIYQKVLPPRPAGLLIGILLGTKNSLDSDFYNNLKATGTLHVVVASGTNVALFSGVLLGTLSIYIGRKKAIAITILLVWLYVIISGLQPPIIRAGLMASIVLASQIFGRDVSVFRVLAIVGIGMLLYKPDWLFDVGFQLSFAATFGVMFGPKYVNRFVKKYLPLPKIAHNDFSTTLSAQIAVSPILIANFSPSILTFLVSPVVNVLILWTVPIIMAFGVVVGLFGLLFFPSAQFVAYFAWLPLEYVVQVVEIVGKMVIGNK